MAPESFCCAGDPDAPRSRGSAHLSATAHVLTAWLSGCNDHPLSGLGLLLTALPLGFAGRVASRATLSRLGLHLSLRRNTEVVQLAARLVATMLVDQRLLLSRCLLLLLLVIVLLGLGAPTRLVRLRLLIGELRQRALAP
jgi:hypothetical protein